jgi:uncharacterized membrane protein
MSEKKDKLAVKKASVLKKDKSRFGLFILVGVCLLSLLAGIFLFTEKQDISTVAVSGQSAEISQRITYPVSMFEDGRAVHFQYVDGVVNIRYFVLKSSDGVLRAAFDACDVCWPSGKGYYQEGDHMVCKNCGQRFASVLINEVRGGCNPEPLERYISGNDLVIRVEDILEGRKYFEF